MCTEGRPYLFPPLELDAVLVDVSLDVQQVVGKALVGPLVHEGRERVRGAVDDQKVACRQLGDRALGGGERENLCPKRKSGLFCLFFLHCFQR